jgi:hypothetical protein
MNLKSHLDSRATVAGRDDLRFLYEQARRYVAAKPWEQLATTPMHLDLKAGSWYEVCAQHFSTGPRNALFVFPGRVNLFELQKAGLGEPPAGTIFVNMVDGESSESRREAEQFGWPTGLRPVPYFKAIMPDGWSPLDRTQIRLLALAFAAISHVHSATDSTEVVGEVAMPGATWGRYRARQAPADEDGIVPIMGVPRDDLCGDEDGALDFTTTPWEEYEALKAGTRLLRASKQPLQPRGDSIPLVTISGSAKLAADVTRKLTAADPLGVTFGEMDGRLGALLIGLNDSYFLVDATEHREELMLWRHVARSIVGGHAFVVAETGSKRKSGDASIRSVHAIFEFGATKD